MAAKPTSVGDLAKAKWESSGISDAQAKKLKLKALPAEQTLALGTSFKKAGSLLIPYFDLKGKPTKFYRIRYLEKLPGFDGSLAKPQRYAQAPGTLNEAYLPPLLSQTWEEIAKDVTIPIGITEGELKAACACALDVPVVGLGGVDVWRSSKKGVGLLPALAAIEWEKRSATIIFDSDAATNPNVVRAQRQLAAELLARGAAPTIASLPSRQDGGKQGLDDFLVAHGKDALVRVISESPFFPEASALWGLNEEVLYVRDPGLVVERDTGRRIAPMQFVAHAYANRHYIETVTAANGGITTKKKSLAKRWVEWESRFEAEKIVYAPGCPQLHEGTWNAWPGWGVEPKKGGVDLWKRLLHRVFRGDTNAIKWFEQWCAYPIQHPGAKMYSAVLLWGVKHGTGKTLIAYLLKAIYGKNGIEINSEKLQASFNAWAENRQFVVGDEITAGDSRLDKDKLKSLITRHEISINQKYLPEYVIADCVNYIFTSNQPDALFMEDNDRRYFVWEVTTDPLDEALAREYDAWLKGEGPAVLMQYLMDVDLTGFNPKGHAPSTSSKTNMILNGKSDLALWAHMLKEDPYNVLKILGEKAAQGCELFTASQLLRAYDPEGLRRVTAGGIAREMARAGFRSVNCGSPVRVDSQVLRLYAVRGDGEWWSNKASPKQIGEHYKKFFGLEASKT
jgi:hypothetical protein